MRDGSRGQRFGLIGATVKIRDARGHHFDARDAIADAGSQTRDVGIRREGHIDRVADDAQNLGT